MSQQYTKGNVIGMLLHSHHYYFLYRYSTSGVGVGSLYEILKQFELELFKLTEDLVEVIQGEEGFIGVVVPPTEVIIPPLEYTEALLKYMRANREMFTTTQVIILDQIEVILSKLLYKLKYFK